jgi:hypothetical protein
LQGFTQLFGTNHDLKLGQVRQTAALGDHSIIVCIHTKPYYTQKLQKVN